MFILFVCFYSILETGKVVIVLAGRHAGKKAVVVKTFDEGNSEKRFSHCLVAGLARNPRKVTKAMSRVKLKNDQNA
jgi:large subunit ribosomal protein L27e